MEPGQRESMRVLQMRQSDKHVKILGGRDVSLRCRGFNAKSLGTSSDSDCERLGAKLFGNLLLIDCRRAGNTADHGIGGN